MSEDFRDILRGWKAICAYAGLSRPTLIRYGFPVRRLSQGSKVFAYKREIDKRLQESSLAGAEGWPSGAVCA